MRGARDRLALAALPPHNPAMTPDYHAADKVKLLVFAIGLVAFGSAAYSAGIDSRVYACRDLQALIAARGFVFISQPAFGDFVVASASFCGGGDYLQSRSVPTTDNPDCPVNYCAAFTSSEGQ